MYNLCILGWGPGGGGEGVVEWEFDLASFSTDINSCVDMPYSTDCFKTVIFVPVLPCSLVCGDVCGKFNALYGRVRNILKKNKEFEV